MPKIIVRSNERRNLSLVHNLFDHGQLDAAIVQRHDKQLLVIKGGEDLEFGRFSLRVVPSPHSEIAHKRYNNSEFAGPVASDLKAPLRESAYREGGTFAYLVRMAGHQVLLTGGMNYNDFTVEIKAASPRTQVIIPEYFGPNVFP